MKQAFVTPILKTHNADLNVLTNYRPISYTPFVAKTTERFVARQLERFLEVNDIHADHQSAFRPCQGAFRPCQGAFRPCQGAFRPCQGAEMALLRIHNDIAQLVDACHGILLVLLDLFAAFNTIDHAVLLWHQWQSTHMADVLPPRPNICVAGQERTIAALHYEDQSFSRVSPRTYTFNAYIVLLVKLLQQHHIQCHLYAENTQQEVR